MPETSITEAIVTLLERQQTLVAQLEAMAERQGPLIEAADSDALLTVLAQRQQIMDQFLASQDDLTRLAESLRRDGRMPEASRRRVGALIEEVTRRLDGVMRRDEAAREALSADRDRIGSELGGLSAARQARRAYVHARIRTNRFADRRG